MPAAGDYRTRLEWFKRTPGTPDAFGQKATGLKSRGLNPAYPSQGFLWCAVEDESGGRQAEKESEHQVTTATVRVRNRPALAPGDQLRDAGRGQVWTVKTVLAARGANPNELVCEVER